MSMTVAQFKTALLKEYPTRDWDQMCVRLCWNAVWLTTGIPESQMHTYSSALAALAASSLEPRGSESIEAYVNRAPLGAIHHWDQVVDGHDGISLGGGMMLHTSDYANNVEKWTGHVFVASVLSYSKGRYRGWSLTLGANIPVALVEPRLEPYQRVVNSGGVSIRVEPTSQSAKVGFFPPKQVVSFIGWSKGELVEGVDVWFKFDADKWCWAGGFTDAGTHDLPDLTPKPEPTPEPEPEPPVVVPPTEPPVVVPPVEPTTPTPQPDKPEPEPKPSNPALNWIIYLIGGVIAAAIGLWAIITGGQP